jgi:hypothetical protein
MDQREDCEPQNYKIATTWPVASWQVRQALGSNWFMSRIPLDVHVKRAYALVEVPLSTFCKGMLRHLSQNWCKIQTEKEIISSEYLFLTVIERNKYRC